jgi:excisionase family DNA binding protein
MQKLEQIELKPAERLSYRVDETAAITGASVLAIEEMVKTGALRHIRAGARTLIPASEVQKLVDGAA